MLLIEDGVLAVLPAHAARFNQINADVAFYVLSADLTARGLSEMKDLRFTVVNDDEFVDLACEHDKVVSWY